MTDENFKKLFNSAINTGGSRSGNDVAAQHLFDFYIEHIKAGFTEEQAMAILLTVLKASLGNK